MLKNELKAALAVVGTLFPLLAHADQPMSNSQMNAQTNGTQQAYVPGEMVKAGQLPAGYNASASYQTVDGWDVYITGDYLYWNWKQDSFKLGDTVMASSSTSGRNDPIVVNPGYASGFQVGLGFNMPGMDDWNLYAEYTWYKNSGSLSTSSDAGRVIRHRNNNTTALNYFNGTATADLHMHFNALDVMLKRPFYFGKKLTASFGAGLSALWITQKLDTTFSGLAGLTSATATTPTNDSNNLKQSSWSLGPKFGFESNWLLGYGFAILANVSGSVLFTNYDLTDTFNGSFTVGSNTTSFSVSNSNNGNNYDTLRPVTQMFLGLGWNMGFCDDSFRFGLSAGYDFDVYWNYDMLNFLGQGNNGNMYLQGLNIQARFDF